MTQPGPRACAALISLLPALAVDPVSVVSAMRGSWNDGAFAAFVVAACASSACPPYPTVEQLLFQHLVRCGTRGRGGRGTARPREPLLHSKTTQTVIGTSGSLPDERSNVHMGLREVYRVRHLPGGLHI